MSVTVARRVIDLTGRGLRGPAGTGATTSDFMASLLLSTSAGSVRASLGVRTKLSAPLTLYVRTDGDDANDGTADSSGGAFATWQKAVDTALSLDTGGQKITIKAGAESGVKTWTVSSINVLGPAVGNGQILFDGNGDNTRINASSNTFFCSGPITCLFGSIRIKSAGGYGSIMLANGAQGYPASTGPIFDTAANAHIFVHDNQSYWGGLNTSLKIIGGAAVHLWVANNGSAAVEGASYTLTGTPNFSTAFVYASAGGYIQFNHNTTTFTGSATGKRFLADGNGVISALGGSDTYFPGDQAGDVSTGGVYIDTTTTGVSTIKIGIAAKIGANGHLIYDAAAKYLQFAVADAGTVTGYAGIMQDVATGGMMFDSPGGLAGLASAGFPGVTFDHGNIGAKGTGAGLPFGPASTTYANDAAAATGGVPVGGVYLDSSSVLHCRRS